MISAIILAAGLSSRMGKTNKLLLPLNGKTMLENTLHGVSHALFDEIIIVCGHQQKSIRNKIKDKQLKIIYNENYKTGMTSSIQTGIKACNPKSIGAMICLGDMPFIKTKDLNKIIEIFKEKIQVSQQTIVSASYKQKLINPVLFSRNYFLDILNHSDHNGCKGIIMNNIEALTMLAITNPIHQIDIDTKNDYEQSQQLI